MYVLVGNFVAEATEECMERNNFGKLSWDRRRLKTWLNAKKIDPEAVFPWLSVPKLLPNGI